MMKRHTITIILLFLVALSFGCKRGEPQRYDVDIHKGTQGFVLKFLPQTPPNVVYSGESVDLQVEVWNRGTVSTNGLLYLTGFDKSIIDVGYDSVDIPEIAGKTEYFREGDKNVVRCYTGSEQYPG